MGRHPENQAFYYSTEILSRTYARIMVHKGAPLQLMAETIRENSAQYPRPIPLDLFEQSPFDLTAEVIQSGIQAMARSEQYRDIAYTTTSEGSIYLYSTDSMDHNYAEFLAEREDVDLMTDP